LRARHDRVPPIGPKHLGEFLTKRYLLSRLASENELRKIEKHLAACGDCRKRVESCLAMLQTIRPARRPHDP